MVFPYQEGLVLLIGASDLNGQGKLWSIFLKIEMYTIFINLAN